MSKGLQVALIAAIVLLALSVAALGAYLFLSRGARPSDHKAVQSETTSSAKVAEGVFFKTKNFVTNLADSDRLRYVDATVALAVKDEAALEVAKTIEPQIRDTVLGQLRQRTAAELSGPAGKDKVAEALSAAISELLPGQLLKVYVTDLTVQ